MNYYDVYFSRLNHLGNTTAERIRNGGIRSFERWLAESPFTVENLSVERNLYFNGIIEENKDKEAKKLMFLHVANDIPLLVGDIMNWLQDDGTIEKWLLLQKEKKVNSTYQTFIILQCNYEIKWIDVNGHLQKQWAYIVSSTDDKIKGNFRTWHSVITPQPNKYAEIIMPRRDVARGTNFVIEDEGWQLIECDITSVAGVMYMSLTESKVNLIYDDLVEDIADTDKLAKYRLETPQEVQTFSVGSIIHPVCTLMKDGQICNEEVEWSSQDKTIVRIIDNELVAVGEGECVLVATLKAFPQISSSLTVSISNTPAEFSAYIDGVDSIRLDRYATYRLVGTSEIINEVNYTLEENEYAEISEIKDNQCVIHANRKNKIGSITLVAEYDGIEYSKTIKIVPLW